MKNIAKYIQNFTTAAALGGRFGDEWGGKGGSFYTRGQILSSRQGDIVNYSIKHNSVAH